MYRKVGNKLPKNEPKATILWWAAENWTKLASTQIMLESLECCSHIQRAHRSDCWKSSLAFTLR